MEKPMLTKTKLNPLWTVHKSAYSAATYREEKKKLLRKTWIFVAHESEFAQTGSFITRRIAGDPILIVKAEDGVIRSFYNTCRHRGSVVATKDEGVAKIFSCPYHNWSFTLKGELYGLPGADAYDAIQFRKEDFPLVAVRTENMCGLIFVCLDDSVPDLKSFLGQELTSLMQNTLGLASYEVYRKEAFPVKANWKLIAENWRDGYHVPCVHPRLAKGSPPQPYKLVDNGHCIQYMSYGPGFVSDEVWELSQKHTLPGLEPLKGFHFHLFPGLVIQPLNNQLQILSMHPIDAENSVWERRALGLMGDSEEKRDVRQKCWEAWSSRQVAEDIVALEFQQKGIMCDGMPISILGRGEEVTEGIRGDDNRLRQFWASWRKSMGTQDNAGPDDMDGI
jgi:phenylpropionate dioxygenase-like ring-hydroxylating dioxygenase large terminal subunit